MSPIKSTVGRSVGKLLNSFRDRDLSLNSSVITDRRPLSLVTTNAHTINTSGSYKYITWIASGSFVASGFPGTANYILVAGGGGGAKYSPVYESGSAGSPSTALGLTAYGGGYGAAYPVGGGYGGSGGGSGGNTVDGKGLGNYVTGPRSPVPSAIPAPLSPQGNDGGNAPAVYGAGGGGGAGGVGGDGPTNSTWGKGGIGRAAFGGDTSFPASYGTPGPTPGRWFAGGGSGSGGSPVGGTPAPDAGGGGAGTGPDRNAVASTGGGGGTSTGPGGGGSGGGGAGGYLDSSMTISPGPYSIAIGGGGAGGGGSGAGGIFVLRVPSTTSVT